LTTGSASPEHFVGSSDGVRFGAKRSRDERSHKPATPPTRNRHSPIDGPHHGLSTFWCQARIVVASSVLREWPSQAISAFPVRAKNRQSAEISLARDAAKPGPQPMNTPSLPPGTDPQNALILETTPGIIVIKLN